MPTLQNGSGALRINVPKGSTLIIRNQSGVETVTGSSAAREDATAFLGANAVVYGPQSASSDVSITTTGVLTYDIVSGDATPATDDVRVSRNAATGAASGLVDANNQPVGGGGYVSSALAIIASEAAARRNNLLVNAPRRCVNISTGAVTITSAVRGATTTIMARNNLAAGDQVRVESITGMPEIAGLSGNVISATKFQYVLDINSSGYAANGTTGTATVLPTTRTYAVTGITNARQAVISCQNDLQVGQQVVLSGVVGMTQINGLTGTVLSSDGVSIRVDIDSTTGTGSDSVGTFANFSAYASGGVVTAFVQDGRVNYYYTGMSTAGKTEYVYPGGNSSTFAFAAPDHDGKIYESTVPFAMGNCIPYRRETPTIGNGKTVNYYPADGIGRDGFAATARVHIETSDPSPLLKFGAGSITLSVIEDGVHQMLVDSTLRDVTLADFASALSVRTIPGGNGFITTQLDFRQSGGTKLREIVYHNSFDYTLQSVLIANTSVISRPALPGLLVVFGDSISAGVTASLFPSFGFAVRLAERLGLELLSASEGGSGYINPGNGGAGVGRNVPDRVREVARIRQYQGRIRAVLFTAGHNDESYAAAELPRIVSNARDSISTALTGFPAAIIWVQGPFNSTAANATNNAANWRLIEAALQALVAEFASPRVRFVPVLTAVPQWITGTGNSIKKNGTGNADNYYELNGATLDGTHPNARCHADIADRWYDTVMTGVRDIAGA
jgi:lysophospholipase L1-like esterase